MTVWGFLAGGAECLLFHEEPIQPQMPGKTARVNVLIHVCKQYDFLPGRPPRPELSDQLSEKRFPWVREDSLLAKVPSMLGGDCTSVKDVPARTKLRSV